MKSFDFNRFYSDWYQAPIYHVTNNKVTSWKINKFNSSQKHLHFKKFLLINEITRRLSHPNRII